MSARNFGSARRHREWSHGEPQPPVDEARCYCWRLDLPHVHTVGQCQATPKPGRR